MTTERRLDEIIAFAQDALEADAALGRAALGEPDDDAYLAIHERAASCLAPPLTPLEGRWAVPGGTSPHATIDVSASVRTAHLYGVARVEAEQPTWVAYTSSKRDLSGALLADAWVIGLVDGAPKVLGRAGLDPRAPGVVWEGAGGRPVPFDAPVIEARPLSSPKKAVHAAWLAERLER